MTLKGDEVRVDRQTQDVEAKGKVSVDDPEWKVKSADSMQINMEKETGEFQNGDIFIEQGHISLMGRRFQKFTGQTYHVDDGFFTTCLCESGVPTWKFSADQMDLTLQGTGIIRHGYFYIMDVPVLYLPYGFFPLRTDRQSGFLFPRIAHSSRDGFRLQQGFFWAISKSTDATFTGDIESNSRAGLMGEFRTKFNQYSDFQLDSSYFNEVWRKNAQADIVDRTIADQRIPKDRWSIIGTHRYTTPSDWLTYSDIAAYSDDLYTRELVNRYDLPPNKEADITVSRFAESRFGVFRGWNDTFVKSEWNFYQDFIQLDSTTLQRTPQLAFWGRRMLSSFPLEFRWQAEGVNYIRRKGGDGLRLDLRPELVFPLKLPPYLVSSLSIAPRETAYHLYQPVQAGDHNVSRELVEIRANVGTSLSKIFRPDVLRIEGIKHILEPQISYLFIPGANQDRIPLMDDVDRIRHRNVVTFGVNNRFWGKFASPLASATPDPNVELLNAVPTGLRELGWLNLALSYDVGQARKGHDSLSDLDTQLRLMPTNYSYFEFVAGVDPGKWNLTQARATFTISDPRIITRRALDPDFLRPNSFSLGYAFLRKGTNGYLAEDANISLDLPADCVAHTEDPRCPTHTNKNIVGNLSANILYHVFDNVLFSMNGTYDVINSKFIGFNTSTKFLSPCDCWTLTFRLNHNINPAKTTFHFDFNLLGLGSQKSTVQ